MEAVFTERAHLMCPNMCFGITAIVNYPYDPARIQETLAHLSAAHPFLNALLGYEEVMEQYVYRITDASQVELLLKENQISGLDAPEILAEYERLTHRDWNLFEEGMLKATVWPCAEKTCFLLVFHHLSCIGQNL